MAWLQMHQLQDTLSQVTFYHFNSFVFQKRVEFAFLGQHGFAFYKMLHSVLVQNIVDNITILIRILCPIDMGSISTRIVFKLHQ